MKMTDEMLSQDEIDALLAINQEQDEEPTTETDGLDVSDYLSSIEQDTIGEIGNISFGSSATTLSTLLNQKVSITTPQVSVVSKSNLYKEFTYDHVKVKVTYVEGFIGENLLVIKAEDAAIISDIMLGGDGTSPNEELNEIHLSAIQEAMNQMMGSAATSMSTVFNKRVNISPPMIELGDASNGAIETIDEEVFVKVSFQLKVGSLIDSSIMQLIPFPFAHDMVEELIEGPQETTTQDDSLDEEEVPIHTQSEELDKERSQVDRVDYKQDQTQIIGMQNAEEQANIQKATFSEFEPVELSQSEHQNLDLLLDIPLKVTVELGRTNRPIKDILDLSAGSIIELDKLAGEPVDILVNQKLIAKGEVVVIDENFGVRVTDIISKSARVMKLN